MAKTIHTILYDDVLDASRIVTMDNCVCQLYDIKRDYDEIIKDSRENLSKPALYVLLNRRKRKGTETHIKTEGKWHERDMPN